MANSKNGSLYSPFEIGFNLDADENVTKVIQKVLKGIDDLEDSLKSAGSGIDKLLHDAAAQLDQFSAGLKNARIVAEDFFKAPDANKYKSAISQIQAASASYEESLAAFVKLQNAVAANGGDTSGISAAIKSLNADLSSLGDTLQNVVNQRLGQLAEKYLSTTDEAERAKIETRALQDAMDALGMDADKAGQLFGTMVEAVKKAGGSFADLQQESAGANASFSSLFKALGNVVSGRGGFSSVMAIARGALSSFIGTLGALVVKQAFQELGKLVKKAIGELKEWVKSWGEVKRAIRDGMGTAASDSLSELRRLDELNNKLKNAQKGTAEYANARKEIISKYGQYNRYLKDEIDAVGDLSQSYERLRESIIEANIEKQRQKALDANDERTGKTLMKSTSRMYRQARRMFGEENASAIYDEALQSILNGSEPESEEARRLMGMSGARRSARRYNRGERRRARIAGAMSNNAGDQSSDFTLFQEDYSERKSKNDIIRRQAQERIDIELEYNQKLVSAMQDGAAKQIAQAKLDFERQKELNRQKLEEYIQQKEDERKALYEMEHGPGSYNPYNTENTVARGNDRIYGQQVIDRENEAAQRIMNKIISDAIFQRDQNLASSYGTLQQRKDAAAARWRREDITSQYSSRASAFHDYELAKMDYEAIQKYGTQDQIRAALENVLNAEIKTLEDAEKPAAEARKKVTLAEFDLNLAETYGGRMAGREALEASLNAELETIDEKYREIKEAMNRVRLAEYDVETANQYGNRSERRAALESLLNAQRNEYLKRNPNANAGRIDAQNAVELAKFDWEEVADYGSYEAMLKALRAKWKAIINELPDDLKEGATRKMRKEILDLEMANSAEYKRIFADADSMTKATLEDTIKYAEALLQAKLNAGASVEEIKALRDQIEKLQSASDAIDFSGWGGTLQGVIQARNKRNSAQRTLGSLNAKRDSMVNSFDRLSAMNTQEWKDLSEQIKNATDASEKWEEELKKQAATLAATKLGDLLSQIGSAMAEVASISGNDKLAGVAEGFSEIGGAVSNIAQGFASGGLWGGIATAVTTVADKIINAFASVAVANAKYEKFLNDFKQNLDMLQLEVNESDFSNAFGVDDYGRFVSAYEKMTAAVEKFTEASGNLNAMDIKTKNYSWWANLFGKSDETQGLKSFDVWGEDGLLDVSKARAFLDASTQLTDTQRTEIENAIELKSAYDELHQSAADFVSSLTGSVVDSLADEMVQNFIDTGSAIVDADKYLQDFNKNLATSIVKSMLMKQIFTEEAQDNIADLIASGDATGAVSAYNDLLQQANELAPEIENFLRGAGVTGDAFKQSATVGGFSVMSQDQAGELNGRFAALQIAGENILLESRGIHADTSLMAVSVEEMRNLSLISMGYLEGIEKNTRVLPEMSERMERIERYSKQMVS